MMGIKFASEPKRCPVRVRRPSPQLQLDGHQGNYAALIYRRRMSAWPSWQALLQPEDRAMNLPQRPLGSSRVMITKTGFGAWGIGGGGWAFGWGAADDA